MFGRLGPGRGGVRRRVGAVAAAVAILAPAAAAMLPGAAAAAGGPVNVLYAGSLTQLMETQIGPAFDKATGYTFQGMGAGALALAQEIASGQQVADVFISASPKADDVLINHPAHGAITWYSTFASSPLVIGYNPKSAFASALQTQPWYKVMQRKGFRLGRTDPKLDPKGQLTVQFVKAAARQLKNAQLVGRVLGPVENAAQVFPEETLVGRLQAGQLDAGFFYRNEAVTAGIPFIQPTSPTGFGATFTVSMPSPGSNQAGAIAFIRFLLGPQGTRIMAKDGLVLQTPALHSTDVPGPLQGVVDQ